jgi:hypothetical protein
MDLKQNKTGHSIRKCHLGTQLPGHSVALGNQSHWALSRRAVSRRALRRSGTQLHGTLLLHRQNCCR